MSGPKSSRYTLTPEQLKRIIEEQERLLKELEDKARKEREIKEANEYLAIVRSKTSRFVNWAQESEQKVLSVEGSVPTETQNRFKQLYANKQQLDTICETAPKNTHAELMRARELAEKLFEAIVSEGKALVAAANDQIFQQKIHRDEMISEGMQLSFASVGLSEETEDPEKERIETELESLLLLDVSEKLRSEIMKAIKQFRSVEDTNARSNFAAVTLDPLKRRCVADVRFRETNAERYRNAYVKYRALCRQIEEKEDVFEFTEDGIAALEKTVSDYEQMLLKNSEQEYISSSVDEVMKEMGYEVIGRRNVRKKTGRSFKSKLLTYEDGTVINVTESSGGQITMEIGGMDDTDRLPDANERVALQKTMGSFCSDFREIEHRLSDRGVIPESRLSMSPPEEIFAQIINYNDYDLTEEFKNIIISRSKATQSQMKKQMRND